MLNSMEGIITTHSTLGAAQHDTNVLCERGSGDDGDTVLFVAIDL